MSRASVARRSPLLRSGRLARRAVRRSRSSRSARSQIETPRSWILPRVRASMKAPPPVESTWGGCSRSLAITRRSPSRKCASPWRSKMSAIVEPAARSISWSASTKERPKCWASRLPIQLLPAPMSPTRTSVLPGLRSGALAGGAGGWVVLMDVPSALGKPRPRAASPGSRGFPRDENAVISPHCNLNTMPDRVSPRVLHVRDGAPSPRRLPLQANGRVCPSSPASSRSSSSSSSPPPPSSSPPGRFRRRRPKSRRSYPMSASRASRLAAALLGALLLSMARADAGASEPVPRLAQVQGAPIQIVPLPPPHLNEGATPGGGAEPPAEAAPTAPAGGGAAPAQAGPPTGAARVPASPKGIEVDKLAATGREAAGVLDARQGGLGAELWRGTPHALVEGLIQALPASIPSPALRELARRLLLTSATPPEGATGGGPDLLSLRAQKLAEMGDFEDLKALMAAAPGVAGEETLARIGVEAR